MTVLKDRLTAAFDAKNNDINSFVWKGPKEELNGQKFQDEIKLIDATDEQLEDFYAHCMSMLYSKDPVNPGRYTLIYLIQQDRDKCNTELYLRYLEGNYMHDDQRARYPRFMYLQDLRTFLSRNATTIPVETYSETPISTITEGMPAEFQQLPINMVMDGCLDQLGILHKKPITLNFITKLGVWFEPAEMKDLTEYDDNGKIRDRLSVVKERLNLRSNVRLKVDPKGLTYAELRAMVNLKQKRFSALTTDQLLVLRNKVLFRLENEATFHAEQWLERVRQLQLVAESRGITLGNDEN